ncbi:MAG: hypothetical protein AB7E81_02675 [Hyphomicrobiaceae bacterium]
MDFFGLAIHVMMGAIGGAVAGRLFYPSAGRGAVGILAGSIGGLLGSQVVERSMEIMPVPPNGAMADLGFAVAGSVGAGVSGLAMAALFVFLVRCFQQS